MKKHRRKTLNILSLTLVLSLIVGLFASSISMHTLSAEEVEAAQEAGQEFIISQDDMSTRLNSAWEDWGNLKYVNDNGEDVIALGNDGGAGIYMEKYSGSRSIIVSARARVGEKETVEPGILQIEYFKDDGSKDRVRIHSFTSHEYEEVKVPVEIPADAIDVQISIYKNPGEDFAFYDYIKIYSLEGEVEGYPKAKGGAVEHINIEDLYEKPTEPETPTEPEIPTEPEQNATEVELGKNLAKNPDFELSYNNNGPGEAAEIEGWDNDLDVDSGNIGQTFITEEGYEGSKSIVTGPGEGGRSQYILNIPENIKFTLKVTGKVSHETETGYFGVDCLDENMKRIAGGKSGGLFTSTDWTEKSIEFTTVPGTKALQLYTYKNSSPQGQESYAYFDNFELVAISDDRTNIELIKNPGFEDGLVAWDGWENLNEHAITHDPVFEGENAILISGDNGIGQNLKLQAGKTYKFIAHGLVLEEGDVVYFGIEGLDKVNNKTVKTRLRVGEFSTTEFSKFEATFTVEKESGSYQVYIWKDGPGKAVFDGFSLVNVTEKDNPNEADNPNFINPINKTEGVFFDDFENGVDSSKWLIGKTVWGYGNNGVSPENVTVENGILKIKANGDLYEGEQKGFKRDKEGKIVQSDSGKRVGGVIATKDHFASGSYEVRARLLNELGVVNAFWTFFNNGERNDEIDWEAPGTVAGKQYVNQIMANTWIDDQVPNSYIVDSPKELGTTEGVAEGWHTYRFDWYTEKDNPRVEFYLDGKHVHTATEKIPSAAGRFWLGLWFPQGWAGEPNFDSGTMEIDWVKITQFKNDGDEWLRGFDNDWADLTEYPNPAKDRSSYKNTNNFAYLDVEEMNGKRKLNDEVMEDFINQLQDYAINMQFVDMGVHDINGDLPQSPEKDALVRYWMKRSRELAPEMKIMGTINANARQTIEISDETIDKMVEEAVRIYKEYDFDGIQVDIEPFNVRNHPRLIQYLSKLRAAVGADVHISIATTALAKYLPNENISEIAKYVDMINPMLYDVSGDDEGIVYSPEAFTKFWEENVLRYSEAIAASENPNVQLAPTMPAYDDKFYPGTPGWPDADSGKVYYHLHEYENILAAAKGLRGAIDQGANVYGSGLFWWGTFTLAEYDQRDSQDYAKDRNWWLEEWIKVDLNKDDTESPDTPQNPDTPGTPDDDQTGDSSETLPELEVVQNNLAKKLNVKAKADGLRGYRLVISELENPSLKDEGYDIKLYDPNGKLVVKANTTITISITLQEKVGQDLVIKHEFESEKYEDIQVLDLEGQTITFRADSFSPYYFVSDASESAEPGTSTEASDTEKIGTKDQNSDKTNAPVKTGASTNVLVWLLFIGVAIVVTYKVKTKYEENY